MSDPKQAVEIKHPISSHIVIHKDALTNSKIGEPDSILLKGVVRSIATHPDHKDLRSVELEHQVDHQGQPKEEPLADMRKKMVEKHGEAEYKEC